MARHAKICKAATRTDGALTHAGAEGDGQQPIQSPARIVAIPPLYLRPMADRKLQGCAKSMA